MRQCSGIEGQKRLRELRNHSKWPYLHSINLLQSVPVLRLTRQKLFSSSTAQSRRRTYVIVLGNMLKMGKSFPITEPLAFESLVMAAAKPLLCAALFTKQGAHY